MEIFLLRTQKMLFYETVIKKIINISFSLNLVFNWNPIFQICEDFEKKKKFRISGFTVF